MSRPREITVTAVVALTGSVLSISFGSLAWIFAHQFALWQARNYPGMTQHDPAILELKNILIGGIVISIVLGLIGIATAFGLLRMQRWARLSIIAWAVASSSACIFGLVYTPRGSEIHLNPVFLLTVMLFLFPINAWWLLLFFRPSTKAQFGIPPSPRLPRGIDLSNLRGPAGIVTAAALVLLGAALVWIHWRTSPMREIERSERAVSEEKSWHYHTVRYFENLPPEIDDTDFSCPVFRHGIMTTTNSDGSVLVREEIRYFGRGYGFVGGQWVPSHGRQADMDAQTDVPIIECRSGAIGSDETALPYDAILRDGAVRRGGIRDVEGAPCRDYDVTLPTPHDEAEKDFRFSICIDERDHLPEQTRRTPPGSNQERVTTYTHWDVGSEPQLPAGFPR